MVFSGRLRDLSQLETDISRETVVVGSNPGWGTKMKNKLKIDMVLNKKKKIFIRYPM